MLGAAATIVGYECDGCDFTYPRRSAVSDRHRRHARRLRDPRDRTRRTLQSDDCIASTGAQRACREIEFIASRLFDDRDPAAVERITHGHAVLGTYVSAGGGTVITSGCTDWVWGLAERDRHVEQITRNIFDRLA